MAEETGNFTENSEEWNAIKMEASGGLMVDQEVRAEIVPADILPEEMWLHIIGKLEPSDMKSCYQTNPQWKELLAPKRTKFLFNEVSSLILEELPLEDLLNCRTVSKIWKESLDRNHQSHQSHLTFKEPIMADLRNDFSSTQDVQRFMQDMESHSGNPFPGRFVCFLWTPPGINEDDEDDHQEDDWNLTFEYWNQVARLLEAFGQHVHFALISLHDSEFIGLEEFPRNLLVHLPNLKNLTIFGDPGCVTEGMRDFYLENPMPALQHLESLEIWHGCPALTDAVLGSCCIPDKIKRLCLIERNDSAEYIFRIQNVNGVRPLKIIYDFHNLEYLEGQFFIEDLEGFRKLQRPPPMKYWRLEIYDEPDFVRIFSAFSVFAKTLKRVKVISPLILERGMQLGTEIQFMINLPKLKKLFLKDYNGPLDPILYLGSLTNLNLICSSGMGSPWKGSIVDFHGFERQMYQSNIWNLIPSLEKLTIGMIHPPLKYTRKQLDEME